LHDLHIWEMSTTDVALTAHLVKPTVEDDEMHDRFGIDHVTLQVERGRGGLPCRVAPADVV
jgi:cobalt-zinc-cadmium efflux system protein